MENSGDLLVILFVSLGVIVGILPVVFLKESTTKGILVFLLAVIGITSLFIVFTSYSLDITYKQILNFEINPRHVGIRRLLSLLYAGVFVGFVLFIISLIKSIVLLFGKK